LIRPGAARTVVEAAFDPVPRSARLLLETLGLDADGDRVVIRREIAADGRSRAWVGGSPATVSTLERLAGLLADLHGQHQTVSLLRPETQRGLLDGFSGAEPDARAVEVAHAELHAVIAEQAELAGRREAALRKADYLRHVVQEIDAARIRPGEDAELDQSIRKLTHADELRSLGDRIGAAIDGEESAGEGALQALHAAERSLTQLERLDPAAGDWRALVEQAYAALEELARAARAYAAGIDEDPGRLEELEARRAVLDRLRRRYGGTLDAVTATRTESAAELDLVDRAEFDLKTLAARRSAAEKALEAAAANLTVKRSAGADRLARAVNRLLPKLGLAGGRFEVSLTPAAGTGPQGAESVQFTVQLNVGLDTRPVHKAASGGELSRIMLALTVALARQDGIPTLVFDEIDQGIGGEVGAQVAEALAEVARRHQVLVITHLPTIAARGDRHLVVAKRTKGGIATSDVAVIHGEDRITELARMLGDPDSASARRHAQALLGATARR